MYIHNQWHVYLYTISDSYIYTESVTPVIFISVGLDMICIAPALRYDKWQHVAPRCGGVAVEYDASPNYVAT